MIFATETIAWQNYVISFKGGHVCEIFLESASIRYMCDLWPPTLTLEQAWILYMSPLTSHLDLGVGINPVYENFDLILILEQTTYFDLGGDHESCTYDLWKPILTLEQTLILCTCMRPLTAYLDLGVGMNPVYVTFDLILILEESTFDNLFWPLNRYESCICDLWPPILILDSGMNPAYVTSGLLPWPWSMERTSSCPCEILFYKLEVF